MGILMPGKYMYGVTITANTPISYKRDKEVIWELIKLLHEDHYETGHLGWELKTEGVHNLHCHTHITGDRMPYMKKKKYAMCKQAYNLNVKITKIFDIEGWVKYCHKMDSKNIHDLYEEYVTQRPQRRRIIWTHTTPVAQA